MLQCCGASQFEKAASALVEDLSFLYQETKSWSSRTVHCAANLFALLSARCRLPFSIHLLLEECLADRRR